MSLDTHVQDLERTAVKGTLLVLAVAAFLSWTGASPTALTATALGTITFVLSQLEARRREGPIRIAWLALLAVDVGFLYWWIGQVGSAVWVIYPLALGTMAIGWWLDERVGGDRWIALAGLVLGSLVLLTGRGWSGVVRWQSLAFTLVTVLTFAVFALGLNLEFGFGGLINFGHVAFMALGAYTVALLAELGGFWATQLGIFVAFLLALAVAAAAGLLLALPAIRLREDYLAIVTIAAAEILRRVLINEESLTHGAHGVTIQGAHRPLTLDAIGSIPAVGPGLVDLLQGIGERLAFSGSVYLLVLFGLAAAITIVLILLAERMVDSPWGRVVEAIREDEDAVRSLAKNPTVYKLQVFALGSAIAAAAGALWAWQLTFIVPQQFAPLRTFWGWIMIVIGGVANNKGAIAGAFLFWMIWTLTRGLSFLQAYGLDGGQIAAISPLVLGLLFVGFMLSKPEGLFGDKEELELVE